MSDPVNRPSHYTFGKYEVIDVITDWGLGFSRGNAVKYIARAGRKNPAKEVEDLEKAVFYLKYEIQRLKLTQTSPPVVDNTICDLCGHTRGQHADTEHATCSLYKCPCAGFAAQAVKP